jgi:flavin-dependent dehydrogenase
MPCLYLGQQAARVAAQALRAGDTSRNALAAYDRLYHGPFRRGLDTEYKIITGLANMNDDELDRLCETLSKINLAPFFFGQWRPMAVETLKWLVTGFPLILRDWRLIRRMMGGEVG